MGISRKTDQGKGESNGKGPEFEHIIILMDLPPCSVNIINQMNCALLYPCNYMLIN